MGLSAVEGANLLALARDSVRHGLEHGRPLAAAPGVTGALAEPGACFVSLHIGGDLRGCIGRTEASPRLVDQLLDNAWAAAFRDPRFPALKRDELDEFSVKSHQKAAAAWAACRFSKEVVPVSIPQRKGDPVVVARDESIRPDTSIEGLAKLGAVTKDRGGMITAGNAPGLNDGGAALVLMSGARVKERGAKPLARVVAYATGGGEPKDLFFAPIVAVQNLMKKDGTTIGDYDLIEANEAFAVQALADGRALGWDWSRVNVNGGAVAIGHPIGASGARILCTLLSALKARGKKRGLAALCLGGGNAVALAVER